MFETVEMRWFFDRVPLDVSTHFQDQLELQERIDWYSMPCNPRCGIKLREGKLEAKLQTMSLGRRDLSPLSGNLESWRKWSLDFPATDAPTASELSAVNWLPVHKRRHLKRFEVHGPRTGLVETRPVSGCEFEMTELTVGARSYWTVGFEAVGPPELLEHNLRRAAEHVIRLGGLILPFTCSNSLGYAEWLAQGLEA
jgi:hypothetical protein